MAENSFGMPVISRIARVRGFVISRQTFAPWANPRQIARRILRVAELSRKVILEQHFNPGSRTMASVQDTMCGRKQTRGPSPRRLTSLRHLVRALSKHRTHGHSCSAVFLPFRCGRRTPPAQTSLQCRGGNRSHSRGFRPAAVETAPRSSPIHSGIQIPTSSDGSWPPRTPKQSELSAVRRGPRVLPMCSLPNRFAAAVCVIDCSYDENYREQHMARSPCGRGHIGGSTNSNG
jgi:hypothetical protein